MIGKRALNRNVVIGATGQFPFKENWQIPSSNDLFVSYFAIYAHEFMLCLWALLGGQGAMPSLALIAQKRPK